MLREVGGLIHAVAVGGLLKRADCEARKFGLVNKEDSKNLKKSEECIRVRNYNHVPNWAKEWGDEIEWVSLKEGIKLSKAHYKPLMIIVEKRDCPKCDILRSQICLSEEFVEASKDFIMVVVNQKDLDPGDRTYRPDGDYTPRALFFHPDGPFLPRYTNNFLKSPNKYFYRSPKNLVRVMNKAKFHFLDAA